MFPVITLLFMALIIHNVLQHLRLKELEKRVDELENKMSRNEARPAVSLRRT
jgi:hypothetical protein